MANTALVLPTPCLEHDTGPMHPESPDRLAALQDAFEAESMAPPRIEAREASVEDIARVHTQEHIRTIQHTCASGAPYPDVDTSMSEGSWRAALLACGGAVEACKGVLQGAHPNAFVAVRPPGHHAEAAYAMGFCLFNNVAVAARWLQAEAGIERVAILDWDIHHGNGTQHAFYEDDTVFYASIHQHPHYPGTGFPHEKGKNNSNLNVQMPPGCAPELWLEALEGIVLPAIGAFDPGFLLLSSGFDAHRLDPLGRQLLEASHYAEMTRLVLPAAGGRIVSLLEGGYHLGALGASALAHFRALNEA